MNKRDLLMIEQWLIERELELNAEMQNTKRGDVKTFLALQFASWTANYWRQEVRAQVVALDTRKDGAHG